MKLSILAATAALLMSTAAKEISALQHRCS
jgi:hypothetical protein